MANAAKDCGFAYARISEISHSYDPPEDLYHWCPGIFHLDGELDKFVDGFLETKAAVSVEAVQLAKEYRLTLIRAAKRGGLRLHTGETPGAQ